MNHNDHAIEILIQRMTLKDKIAQITGIWLPDLLEGDRLSLEKCRTLIPNGIGHVSQFSSCVTLDPATLRQVVMDLQHYLRTETPTRIPAIFHEEAITGFAARGATTFPQQIGMGCSWNPELLERNTRATARLMRQMGATHALSPMLDICRDPCWGRVEESFGEDPYLSARMGLAFVRGLQGNDLAQGVAATSKHFAGHGGGTEDPRTLWEDILFPHEVAIRLGGAESVMPGYHSVNGVPCTASKELFTDILRDLWGFEGLAVSDYGSVEQVFSNFKQAPDVQGAAVKSLLAGIDVELPRGVAYPLLAAALQAGNVAMPDIDRAVRRVLRLKARLGLLAAETPLTSQGPMDMDPPENRAFAYESACQAVVLLKNDGILPLAGIRSIALVGPNADAVQSLCGDYTYQSLSAYWWNLPTDPDHPRLVTLLEGLKAAAAGAEVRHERGCDWSGPLGAATDPLDYSIGDERLRKRKAQQQRLSDRPTDPERAVQMARESDVIIAAMGENLFLCGEGRNRTPPCLPGDQEAFLEQLSQTGKPLILVLFGGRPMLLNRVEPLCRAIIHAWYPGEEGGRAVADILFGTVNPTAKLCMSIPHEDASQPSWYGDGYRARPLYPFGHGLSYTRFGYRDLAMPQMANLGAEWIPISFTLQNEGPREGAEIAQLYVRDPLGDLRLKGFTRVMLGVGESRRITFLLSPQQLARHDGNKGFVVIPGSYQVMIGASSLDARLSAPLTLDGNRVAIRNRSTFFSETVISANPQ
jgi:beta-glucosidase